MTFPSVTEAIEPPGTDTFYFLNFRAKTTLALGTSNLATKGMRQISYIPMISHSNNLSVRDAHNRNQIHRSL
jgi:hypothetical protein